MNLQSLDLQSKVNCWHAHYFILDYNTSISVPVPGLSVLEDSVVSRRHTLRVGCCPWNKSLSRIRKENCVGGGGKGEGGCGCGLVADELGGKLVWRGEWGAVSRDGM